ncbi:hypothetical protein DPX39_010048200 [Trypanosoma brucei equiperdum]|uniref:Uncharacterized protein n=1 Tax=Trypanosoma brucei equiperdum TaxID=630700 RepID=A0A3L6LDR4_9TRYP|nr:hypothetical protein DPX39_010048200 [Trypanosoma brucei equiperdum]
MKKRPCNKSRVITVAVKRYLQAFTSSKDSMNLIKIMEHKMSKQQLIQLSQRIEEMQQRIL